MNKVPGPHCFLSLAKAVRRRCRRRMVLERLSSAVIVSFFLAMTAMTTTTTTYARPYYASLIPNGYSVPNPGPQGGVWAGVGHLNAGGGGPRNPFGLDFAAANFRWTESLCRSDSDGDGRSNGEELGDPSCVWRASTESDDDYEEPEFPARSHPGIVDTVDNTTTGGGILDPCQGYEPPEDVVSMDILFSSPNNVDETRTHYRCEQKKINIPNELAWWSYDYTFDQIRDEVLLDNSNILHHIWIYVCDEGINSSDGNRVGWGPYSCSGMEANCMIYAGWAVGGLPFCQPPNVGNKVYFDNWGQLTVKIEAHYDNPTGVAQVDQSGMRLSLTPTPRALTSGMVILGMDYYDRQFEIPPQRSSFQLTNICPTSATSMLDQPIYVYSWNPHMHLHGKALVTEHYRCGVKIGEIGRIDSFEFNYQQSYFFPTPIKILPGDALVTTCTYNSTDVDTTIKGGEETTEEMCDNYLTFYPSVTATMKSSQDNRSTLFSACSSFAYGLNPNFVGYNDYNPFATLDLGGTLYVPDFELDPTKNVADCCSSDDGGMTTSCEEMYRSAEGFPCAVDDDCIEGSSCEAGLCVVE